jgi:CheY-like chemotaxis protein
LAREPQVSRFARGHSERAEADRRRNRNSPARLRGSALSLLRILDDILDFSKVEAGKLELETEPMQLAAAFDKVCAQLAPSAVGQGVAISVFVDPAIPRTVLGDEARLRQMLDKLVGNAIKFSGGLGQPAQVSVRAVLAGRQGEKVSVDLTVADNGIGMSEAMQAKLFTPFSQADASMTRRYGGTGLGLAIADMLVRLMGGRISVVSALGKGSTFTVRLRFATTVQPLAGSGGGSIAASVPGGRDKVRPVVPSRDEALRKRRLILVAEDNETNRKVIVEQLRLIGFAADIVVDGREALASWRTGDFALLLTDLQMPEMDGYALAVAIRAEEGAGRRTPIIALTANALRDDEARCLALGMDAYLTKPVQLSRLKATIEAGLAGALHSEAGVPPPEAASKDTDPPADLRVLAALVGDDPAVIEEMVQAFGQAAAQARQELGQCVAGGSMQSAKDTAHKMKSGARSIGAFRLGAICEEIERSAGFGAPLSLESMVARFDRELDVVQAFLDSSLRPA